MTKINVTPIDFTGAMARVPDFIRTDEPYSIEGHQHPSSIFAAAKLIFTKSTRLNMSAGGFDQIFERCWRDWSWAEQELKYMAGTIPSSWEFVSVTFMIENVSRACAQQITRTRIASFAMQSQRVTDMSDVTWCNPIADRESEESLGAIAYDSFMDAGVQNYSNLLGIGISLQDARGVLPMNVHCNLVAEYNLRTIVDLVQSRDNATRVQGEYFEVVQQIKLVMIELYPWVEIFFEPKNEKAIDKIQGVIDEINYGASARNLENFKVELAKAIDLIKKG